MESMGITNSNKTVSETRVSCGGSFHLQLSLAAAPDILTNPTDIVLILDRSGSMQGDALAELKEGAKAFIDIIADATGGGQTGQIGGGSRIGIVSFAATATQDTGLITDVTALKTAVDNLTANGSTNHADAFAKALALLEAPSTNAKVMVMFTDGVTTTGADPAPVAEAAKALGITIYAVGLEGNGGVDVSALTQWASDPATAFVIIVPSLEDLAEFFADLARNIVKPGATNIVLTDQVNPCFRITELSSPTKGVVSMRSPTEVIWTIDTLGATEAEGATLDLTLTHVGDCTGLVTVNEAITYEDAEGNAVSFPDPTIFVDCGVIVEPEPCPTAVDIAVSGCEEVVTVDAGTLALGANGRILQMNVTLENVCPGRRVALAAVLTQVDDQGEEHQRGMKVMTVPAHNQPSCRDVEVRCIRFVLPEDTEPTQGCGCLCSDHDLRVRFFANYLDSGFTCCPNLI